MFCVNEGILMTRISEMCRKRAKKPNEVKELITELETRVSDYERVAVIVYNQHAPCPN